MKSSGRGRRDKYASIGMKARTHLANVAVPDLVTLFELLHLPLFVSELRLLILKLFFGYLPERIDFVLYRAGPGKVSSSAALQPILKHSTTNNKQTSDKNKHYYARVQGLFILLFLM